MKRNIIASVLAATVSMTSFSAAPANANEEDVAKALFGLALLAAIGKMVEDDDPAPAPAPAPLPVTPVTYSTGPLVIPQTWLADLDEGHVDSTGADIWIEAETASLLYVTPRNGAKIAVGDRSNRGFDGCSAASFSSARVSLADIPVGSYVCAKTNEGRISQFRVNAISGISPKNLSLGYTTWQ